MRGDDATGQLTTTGEVLKQALDAVLIASKITFPPVHDLARLLTYIEEAGEEVPPSVERAARLTRFAVATRYPGFAESVTLGAYEEAVEIAE
jgi:HEPN domain-containing protein